MDSFNFEHATDNQNYVDRIDSRKHFAIKKKDLAYFK